MLLRRIAVADPFAVLRDEMGAALAAGLPRLAGRARGAFPTLNVWEDEHAVHIEAELPGWALADIDVSVFDHELTIKSAKASTAVEAGEQVAYLRRERFAGEFERTVNVPTDIDPDRVEATLINGVLTVRLPKAASAQPRKVAIKSA